MVFDFPILLRYLQLLQGIPHVTMYIDDMLITTESEAEKSKSTSISSWLHPSMPYLVRVIDGNGIHQLLEKVIAICQAPIPKNMMVYLGLLT